MSDRFMRASLSSRYTFIIFPESGKSIPATSSRSFSLPPYCQYSIAPGLVKERRFCPYTVLVFPIKTCHTDKKGFCEKIDYYP